MLNWDDYNESEKVQKPQKIQEAQPVIAEEKVEGEIYISIPQVERNARKFDQSFSRELSRIIIHGSLHLLNYDDSTIDSKIKMTEKENYFLKKTNWKNLV